MEHEEINIPILSLLPFILMLLPVALGNGPNFMVKAVAEENNIMMPDFFSYMVKFLLIILLPVFVIVQFIIFQMQFMNYNTNSNPWHAVLPVSEGTVFVNSIIEIPKRSKGKYELDKEGTII